MITQVVTVSNRVPTEPYYRLGSWKASLARYGVEPVILGIDKPWHGLVSKPRHLLKWLKSGACNADCLMFVDSWDVVCVRNPNEMAEEWTGIGKPWICSAEKALFPPDDESVWPESSTPYRFLNSGGMISTPEDMVAFLEAMNPDKLPNDHENPDGSHFHSNDQRWTQELFLKQPIPMRLDTECKFFWSLCHVPFDSYEMRDGKVFNKDTSTFPGWAHANGGAKEEPIFLDILKNFNL